jgi:negative regulator of sigma-B (phosphoserine phosphatase)
LRDDKKVALASSDRHRVEYAEVNRPHCYEHVSGDATVVRAREHLLFAAIVDVLGHGPEAHEIALRAQQFLTAHWSDSMVDLMAGLHDHLSGSRGAGAGLCLLDRRTGLLRYTGIGNTVIRRFGSGEVRLLSRAGIIGGSRRSPKEEQMSLAAGDVVLLYTDGVKDRFELQDYPQLLHHGAETIAATVVERFGKEHDDAACIALRYEQ